MSGLSDLHDYDMTDAERLALCAELERLNRVSPPDPAQREEQTPSPCGLASAGSGDHSKEERWPLDVHLIQRVTHSTPPVTITAPAPEHHCVPYDIASEANREAYIAQSAATRDGKVAEFLRR